MKISKTILFIITGLIVIIYIAISLYIKQVKTNSYNKEFLTSLDRLQNDNLTVNYDVLSISLFEYSNDDKIAKDVKKLTHDYIAFRKLPILKEQQYNKTLTPLMAKLGKDIKKKETDITWFLILNANIKNSIVFLSNYARKSRYYFKASNPIHVKINNIINKILYIKRTQDSSYGYNFKLLLSHQTLNAKQLNYIHTFNLHDTYIQTHLHNFIDVTNKILNSSLQKHLQKIYARFSTLARHDNRLLKIQTVFLLIASIIGALFMIFLALLQEKINKKLKLSQKELLYQASHDNLTGLLNRYSLEGVLKKYGEHILFLIDINDFKHINELYGTEIANTLLQEFAQIIKQYDMQKHNASYYRISGDVFVILTEQFELKYAVKTAKHLQKIILAHNFNIQGIDISVDVKIAINNTHPLLENADIGLKDIKSTNKNSIMVYADKLKLREQIQHNIDTLNIVKHAIQNNQIKAFFQPIFNLKSQKIEKYEALVRIIKEDGAIMPPVSFLGVIQNTPLYYNITKIMIEKITKMAQQNKGYRFSLNLSMQDISNKKLMFMLFNKLKIAQINGASIDIELLETQDLYDVTTVQAFIKKAHQHGCNILIDDFGTGYSNFSYLSQLDVDVLKIDASIVKNILIDPNMLQIIKTIVMLAKSLNMQTVAEFVDNQDVANKLQEIGVDYIQGYLIGKPDAKLLKTR